MTSTIIVVHGNKIIVLRLGIIFNNFLIISHYITSEILHQSLLTPQQVITIIQIHVLLTRHFFNLSGAVACNSAETFYRKQWFRQTDAEWCQSFLLIWPFFYGKITILTITDIWSLDQTFCKDDPFVAAFRRLLGNIRPAFLDSNDLDPLLRVYHPEVPLTKFIRCSHKVSP